MSRSIPNLRKAVELAATVRSDMEQLSGIQAKVLWSYYNQLKKVGFTDTQAFKLVENAAPKQLELKLSRKSK